MESSPLNVWKEPVAAAGPPEVASRETPASNSEPGSLSGGARLPLPARGPERLRQYLGRGAAWLAILIAADLLSFILLRTLVRVMRDYVLLRGPVAAGVESLLPPGSLSGWQYALALFVGLFVTGNYGQGDHRHSPRRLFLACTLGTALPLWVAIWTLGIGPVLLQYVVTTVLMWTTLLAERLTIKRVAEWIWPAASRGLETMFVGSGAECVNALQSPAFMSGVEYRSIGFVDSHLPVMAGAIGHVAQFSVLLAATGAQVVVICGRLTDEQFRDIVETALVAGCQVLSLPRAVNIAGVHPTTVWHSGQPLVELTAPALNASQFAIKRVVDVAGSVVGLGLAAPLMVGIALAIKLDSPGPVFFFQDRIGLGGRPFWMLKFRTMREGADAEKHRLAHLNHSGDPRLFKIPNDPRVTRLGATLRQWSLDELPQLWNVLAGDMSLVGPRPFFGADLHTYEDRHFKRLGAKPGITGLWQIKGRSDVIDFEEVVQLDQEYLERWSVWLDLSILVLTLPTVLRRRGAY